MPVAAHIPRESNAWRKVRPLGIHAGIGREPWIARKVEAWRRIGEADATDALLQTLLIVIHGAAFIVVYREVRLPAQTVIDGQLLIDLPHIAAVEAGKPGCFVLHRIRAILELGHITQKVVGHSQSGRLAVEGETQTCLRIRIRVQLPVGHLPAESELAISANNTDVISDREYGTPRGTRSVATRAQAAGHAITGEVR